MKWFIVAAALVAAQWQPANAQAILGSIPEEFRGDWCWQENTNDEQIFKSGACKLKAGSLSIDRMTLDRGRLSCLFDSGTTSDGILNMRLHCSDAEEKQPSMYGAQVKLRLVTLNKDYTSWANKEALNQLGKAGFRLAAVLRAVMPNH
jgi:hypothetical protein